MRLVGMIFDYVTSPLSLLVCLLDSMIAIIFVTIPYDLIKFRRFNYFCLFMFVCTFFWIVGLIKKESSKWRNRVLKFLKK